jgi:hypothetical protein
MLCDTCDAGWHTFCLDPPLDCVPDGDWLCPDCASKKTEAAAKVEKKDKPKLTRLKKGGDGEPKAAAKAAGTKASGRGGQAAADREQRKAQLALAAARRRVQKAQAGLDASQLALDALRAPKGQRRVGGGGGGHQRLDRAEPVDRDAVQGIISTHNHK